VQQQRAVSITTRFHFHRSGTSRNRNGCFSAFTVQLISRLRLLRGRLGREHSEPEVWRGGDDEVGEALGDAVVYAGAGEGDGGVRIRVIAGEAGGVSGAVKGVAVDPVYLDILLPAETEHSQPIPDSHTALCYVFEGDIAIVNSADGNPDGSVVEVPHHTLAVLGEGEAVRMRAGAAGGRALLVAGKPLSEPVVRYGPFVMNTCEEIEQAIHDYRAGRF